MSSWIHIPTTLGMTKITEPKVLTYVGSVPEDWGLSGFVIIAESHISVHTFPSRNYINVDIFSCKEFDSEKALEDVKRIFGAEKGDQLDYGAGAGCLACRFAGNA